jgi:Tol biopolymer transport system component
MVVARSRIVTFRNSRSLSTLVLPLALLLAAPAIAGTVRQITDDKTTLSSPGALDDAGTAVFVGASVNQAGANPSHTFQVFRFDPAIGTATQITTAEDGTAALVSVSDDGQWLVFASPADLTGQNHDQSTELYVMAADGTQLAQLTDDPAVNAGSVSFATISGDGSRIAFTANTDPLGSNPSNLGQLFVIDRDGSNLAQLTALTDGSIGGVSIADDGSRIVFSSSQDLTGGNADLGSEVLAINADGSGLRQLTNAPLGFGASGPALSGNGLRVAFQSDADLTGGNTANQTEVFVVDWDGTNLAQLTSTSTVLGITGDPASSAPSITDDGQTIVFYSNNSRLFPPLNIDGNFEIYRINADGSGLAVLTGTLLEAGSFLPIVSGSGNRIVYYGVDTEIKLQVMDGNGNADLDLLTFDLVLSSSPDVSADGSTIAFLKSTGLFGGDQVWTVGSDGSGLAQVTNLATGGAAGPSLSGDGQTLVFSADSDPTGGNADGSAEIFRIDSDGSGIAQLTSGATDSASQRPVLAQAAPVVVFDSNADLTGGNLDLSREIFKVGLDGTGLVQLTDGVLDTTSRTPRVDASGTWVVFESNADMDGGNPDGGFEVWRVRTDGAGLERITGDPVQESGSPDISGAGDLVTFTSAADPLGTNPELNAEIFTWDPAGTTFNQLTAFAEGSSGGGRLSGDGAWVYFSSDAPVFERDPDTPTDLYRIPSGGGGIERVGALRAGALGGIGPIGFGGGGAMVPDDSGDIVVFTGIGDFTEANKDLLSELWVIDRLATPAFEIDPGAPAALSWTHGSGPLRYDAIRGDIAALGDGGAVVDLGSVLCLEDDSPDADTAGFEDPDQPLPGQAFFYLYRGTQGLLDGPGTYGAASDGRERVAGAGDCNP